MKRALILDFGGVISRTLFETPDETERALGLPAGTLTWRGPFDPSSDSLWQAMQRGELSERDYWLQRAREVGARAVSDLGVIWSDKEVAAVIIISETNRHHELVLAAARAGKSRRFT
jgi:putative hydrolase of the HAD superfamily